MQQPTNMQQPRALHGMHAPFDLKRWYCQQSAYAIRHGHLAADNPKTRAQRTPSCSSDTFGTMYLYNTAGPCRETGRLAAQLLACNTPSRMRPQQGTRLRSLRQDRSPIPNPPPPGSSTPQQRPAASGAGQRCNLSVLRAGGIGLPLRRPLCAAVREAARRTLSSRKLDRDIVSPEYITALVTHHLSGQASLRVRMHVTCAVLGYSELLRYSDLSRVMVHHDLLRFYLDDRVELFLFTSKTDQHCEGALVPIGRISGPCCPVRLLEELLSAGQYKRYPAQEQRAANGSVSMVNAEDVGPLQASQCAL